MPARLFVTACAIASALAAWPAFWIISSVWFRPSSARSAIRSRAPSRANNSALARPMPLAASGPVAIARVGVSYIVDLQPVSGGAEMSVAREGAPFANDKGLEAKRVAVAGGVDDKSCLAGR